MAAAALVVAVFGASCATNGAIVEIGGPSESRSTIRTWGTRILTVDGIEVPSDARVLHIVPGTHVIVVESNFCTDPKGPNYSCYSTPRTCGPVSFATKPSFEYHVVNDTDDRGVWIRVEEMTPQQVVLGWRLRDFTAISECLGRPIP